MAKPTNHRQPWTPTADAKLRDLARGNTPTRVIGIKTGRTPAAVQKHASEIGVSLKPTNPPPYNRRAR